MANLAVFASCRGRFNELALYWRTTAALCTRYPAKRIIYLFVFMSKLFLVDDVAVFCISLLLMFGNIMFDD